jgi:hypothetical protein
MVKIEDEANENTNGAKFSVEAASRSASSSLVVSSSAAYKSQISQLPPQKGKQVIVNSPPSLFYFPRHRQFLSSSKDHKSLG